MPWVEGLERFKKHEFPSVREISLADPIVFKTLDNYAICLKQPVHPSPARGALSRTYGSKLSQHYAVGRLSTAVDFFPDGDIMIAWITALHYFGGVGAYFETHYQGEKRIMIHGDLRNKQVLWYRDKSSYHYIHSPKQYKDLFNMLCSFKFKNREGVKND